MNVLSLFDGISCAQEALSQLGVEPEVYYSSEVDRNAIKQTQSNFPKTIQLGDVLNWREWGLDWSSIDLLMGGFPCQAFSFSGKQKGFDDERGKLAIVTSEILDHAKKENPKLKFLFENVKMKKEHLEYINSIIGVDAVELNSINTSAQNRVRNYWTNIPIDLDFDGGEDLCDILESPEMENPSVIRGRYLNKATIVGRRLDENGHRKDYDKNIPITQCLEVRASNTNKSNCLTTVSKDTVLTNLPVGRHADVYVRKLPYRNYTRRERLRLMNLPDNYCDLLSDNQVVKATGNGWEIGMIKQILKGLK